MGILIPISESAFPDFKTESIKRYAEANIISGRWSEADATVNTIKEYDKLLPQGFSTPRNFIFDIVDQKSQTTVGNLWVFFPEKAEQNEAFIYDLYINEPFRRQGYARQALQALDDFCQRKGATNILLHVFGYNTIAQLFYKSIGYDISGMLLKKRIDGKNCNI